MSRDASKKLLTVQMPVDEYDALAKMADEADVYMSQIVRGLVADAVEHGIVLPDDNDGPDGRIKPNHQPAGPSSEDLTSARDRVRGAAKEVEVAARDLGKLVK